VLIQRALFGVEDQWNGGFCRNGVVKDVKEMVCALLSYTLDQRNTLF